MVDRALILAVNRAGGELLPDNDRYTNRFEIGSESSDRLYTIAQNKATYEWSCSCPGWKMKRAGKERSCKHLKVMMPTLSCIGVQPQHGVAARRIAS